MKINYTVNLVTPALTGQTGIIGKDIDVVTKRGMDGLPFFPAKHIKGIVRDKYQYYFGENANVKNIFGHDEDKYETMARFTHLELSGVYGTPIDKLSDKEKVVDYLYGHRLGIRVDRETRTTIENSLFNYEYANAGLEFSGEIEFNEKVSKGALKEIIATLLNIDSIGGQKSRGLGKVEVKVEGLTLKELDTIVDKVYKEVIEKTKKNLTDNNLKKYKLEVEFLEDAVLTKFEKGNLIGSSTEINPSALRASVISQLAENYEFNINNIVVTEPKPEGSQLLPKSYYKTKYPIDGKTQYVNKLYFDKNNYESKDKKEESKLERADIKFINPEKFEEVKFQKESEISIAIDRETRSAEESKLFNFEIAKIKGKKFTGTIETSEELKVAIDGLEIYIGKMKNRGYGKAKLTLNSFDSESETLENRIKKFDLKSELNNIYTLDIVTDTILPFRNIDNLAEQIKEFYNLEGEFVGDKSFIAIEKLAGYSLLNHMPKSDELVLKAGSVITYKGSKNMELFEKLETKGIGLRKVEGFGRIEFCSNRHFLLEEGDK
jgi:CRISPR/Cas system CSM-associated protein Csm3 (group 7 of RAMP superfamily)